MGVFENGYFRLPIEDLTQEVFLSLWKALTDGNFDKERKIESYLAAIAHHKASKYLAKTHWREYRNSKGDITRKKQPRFICLDRLVQRETKNSNLLEIGVQEEREERIVKSILSDLNNGPDSNGKKCLRAYIGGERYKDIASRLGISTGSVSANIWYMRKKLREKFQEELESLKELYED